MPDTLVVDCSVAAKWILPESDCEPALDLLDSCLAGDILLIAPDLLLVEFASLIAKRKRRGEISAAQAKEAFGWIARSAPPLYETRPLVLPALELSLSYHMSLWDCVYVALALKHDCSLVTADARLFRAGQARHPSIRLMGS
jgi:predicted nucleic acid-binding protein